MVLLTVGLSVQFHDFKSVVGLAACVGLVNLVVMPLLMMPPAHAMNLPH
jgi:predicted permease